MAVLVESLMGIPGVVAVARVERREATGPAPPEREPAYLLYYRDRWTLATSAGAGSKARSGSPAPGAVC